MSDNDDLLENNAAYAATFALGELPMAPRRKLAVVACMDSRVNLFALLGLQAGEAHLIRNAGGVVTADVIRSLAISQRLGGTSEIILIHHTDCGLLRITDDGFRRAIHDDVGMTPDWTPESFTDLDEDVRQSIARVKGSPFVPHTDVVRGFVYDVDDGTLRQVS